jgi:hypothetical protein
VPSSPRFTSSRSRKPANKPGNAAALRNHSPRKTSTMKSYTLKTDVNHPDGTVPAGTALTPEAENPEVLSATVGAATVRFRLDSAEDMEGIEVSEAETTGQGNPE